MNRQYDIIFRGSTGKFDIIAKDDYDTNWFVYSEGLEESIARAAIKGLEAGE